jgi:hypothetical protein
VATDPLLSIAEELYALAPGEFTGTRNQWAKQTKGEGEADLAARVAELRRPSLAAWVVNMMMRHQAEQMAQVLALGASLRQAQSDLDGDALRELTKQRRQLTAAVTHQGRVLAGELGQKVTDAVADQVQGTLHAAMVDEDAAAAVRSGLLVAALESTGVGTSDLAEAVAVPEAIGRTARPRSRPAAKRAVAERPALRVVGDAAAEGPASGDGRTPDADEAQAREAAQRAAAEREAVEREARRRAAHEALDSATEAAEDADLRLRKAQRRRSKVQARTLQTADELDQARRRVAELEHDLEGLADEAAAAEDKQDRAERRVAEAREAVEAARAALAEVEE